MSGTVTVIAALTEISAGRNITFGDEVILNTSTTKAVIQTTANNGNIIFEDTINSNRNLELLANGTGKITFSDDVTVSGNTNPALKVTSGSLDVQKTIDTSSGTNRNIEFIVNELTTNNVTASINAGNGNFSIRPEDSNYTIEYGDEDKNIAQVYYSSAWDSVTALSFTVGGTSQNGDISLSGVSSAPFELSVQTNGTIHVAGDYTSLNHKVNLIASAITFPNTLGSSRTINLGTAAFSANHPVALNNIDDVTITASGGISFSDVISAAGIAANNLTLDAGSGDITVAGTVGTNAARLGTLTVSNARDVDFSNAVYTAGFIQSAGTGTTTFTGTQNYSGAFSFTGVNLMVNNAATVGETFSFTGTDLTVNDAVTVTGETTITNNGLFTTSAAGEITARGGLTQDGTGTNRIGADITTTSTPISFAANIELTLNETVTFSTGADGGNIALNGAIIPSAANTQSLTLNSGSGDITIAETAGTDAARLGILTISSANDADFSSAVHAVNFIQSAGTGTTTFADIQNYSGSFSFTGTGLTVEAALNAIGIVVIDNNGVFSTGTDGTIEAAGGFTQKDSGSNKTGTNSIGANITTANTNMSFSSPIEFTSPVVFSTGPEDGNIELNGNTSASVSNVSLMLNAGTGNISANDLGAPNPHWFSTLTVSGTTITFNGNVHSEGSITITGTNINNDGHIHAGPAAADGNAVIFEGIYEGLNDGQIIGSPDSDKNPNIIFKENVTFNNNGIILNGDVIKFEGTAQQIFKPAGNLFEGKIVINNKNGVIVTESKGAQNGELAIYNGTLTIDPSSAWLMDTSNMLLSSAVGFVGNSGILAFGDTANQAAALTTLGFSALNEFTFAAEGTGTKTVTSSGNITIGADTLGTSEQVDFIIIDAGSTLVHTNDKQIGNLVINNSDVSLESPLSVRRNIIIQSGTLDVSSTSHKITVGRHWRQYLKNNAASPNPFNPRNGTVKFTAETGEDDDSDGVKEIHIQGSTTWFNFESDTPARIVIKFARNDLKIIDNISHTFSGKFIVKTIDPDPDTESPPNDRTLLTKMDNADYDESIFAVPADENSDKDPVNIQLELNRDYFWTIKVETANMDFDNVTVKYSWAEPKSINLMGARFDHVDAVPHLADLTDSSLYAHYPHYCVGWTEGIEFIYSYTEDSDYDGRIDRIRVQASTTFTGVFDPTLFNIEVDGYKVKGSPTRVTGENDMFYINLEPQPYADGGNVLTWRLLRNDSITEIDSGLNYSFMTILPEMETFDTTWPIVHYSLMLPKNADDSSTSQELFIQFSEPVTKPEISVPGYTVKNVTAISPVTLVNPVTLMNATYASEYLITFDPSDKFTIEDMTKQLPYKIYNSAAVVDFKPELPLHSPDYPYPRIPVDAKYEVYSLIPPYDTRVPLLLENPKTEKEFTFRITDILISIPPVGPNDKRYFAWPVFGRDEIGFREPFQPADEIDLVAIRKFDGSGTLRDMEITLDVMVNPLFSPNPDLIMGASVPSSFRGTSPHTSDGLWLFYKSGLVPKPFGLSKRFETKPASSPSNNLVYYLLGEDENDYTDMDVVDFYFTIPNLDLNPGASDLAAGHLDIAPGAPIPTDWYRRIKPFSFNIKELVLQRGGATILNNVINPTKGEKTYLDYTITRSGPVTVQVFTMDGTLVQVLYRGSRSPGDYMESWDGKNRGGRVVARGMYFIRIVGPSIDEIRKVMVVK